MMEINFHINHHQVTQKCPCFVKFLCMRHQLILKDQLHKKRRSRRHLNRHLEPLLQTGFSLMENILKPLAKSFPIPLGLTVGAAAATDAVIQKKKKIILHDYISKFKRKWMIS